MNEFKTWQKYEIKGWTRHERELSKVRNVNSVVLKFPYVTRRHTPDFGAYPCERPNLQFAYRLFPSSIQLILIITLDTHVISRLRRFSKSTPFPLCEPFRFEMNRLWPRLRERERERVNVFIVTHSVVLKYCQRSKYNIKCTFN